MQTRRLPNRKLAQWVPGGRILDYKEKPGVVKKLRVALENYQADEFDIVIHVGCNDISSRSVDAVIQDFYVMLDQLKELSFELGKEFKISFCTLPPRYYNDKIDHCLIARIDAINCFLENLCFENGYELVDLRSVQRNVLSYD